MAPQQANLLLTRLSADRRAQIGQLLKTIKLERGQVVVETGEKVSQVYFPHGGILSFVVDLPSGGAIETGMIGRDGVFGASQALDERISLNRVTVQAGAEFSVLDSGSFCKLAMDDPELRKLTLGYEQFFIAQIQQTAACNAVHTVTQRICKWMLRMHYLVGNELDMTQEFLAQMMGVRRTSVSGVARDLQFAGLIEYHRGRIIIRDIAKMKALACECDSEIMEKYRRLFAPNAIETL